MHLTYDESADAVYVQFDQARVERTDELGETTAVDYDANDMPVGVEFLDVSEGIDLNEVPRRDEIARLLEDHPHSFKIYA